MPKSSKIVNFYQKVASDLKKLGVISYPDTRNLSPQQKGWVTRRAAEYAQVLAKPENFHIAKVSKKTAAEFKGAGYKVTKTQKLIVPLHTSERGKFESAKISKGKIIFKAKGITETVTPSNAKNFHAKIAELSKKKLKNNQMLTVKIGDNASFNSRFDNINDLFKYLTTTFKPNGGKTAKDLSRYMSIVEVEKTGAAKNESSRNSRKPANKKAGQVTRKNPSGK
jgi:hypothetical protein